MKISLSQLNFHIGFFEQNTRKILHAIKNAKEEQCDIVVFPEMAVSGYPPRDFLEFEDFIDKCYKSIEDIAAKCKGIAAVVGGPSRNTDQHGKSLYNSAFFLADGKIQAICHKTLLPTYDIFDEYRYFEPNDTFSLINYKGYKFALTICEDLWNVSENPIYKKNPLEEFTDYPDFIINIAASPFHYKQEEIRKTILIENANKYKLPIFYVNHVGAQTELLFDGGSMVINPTGEIAGELEYFKEDQEHFDLDSVIYDKNFETPLAPKSDTAQIYNALVMGIKNYFDKLGFKKAILGLSGGIDSAVTLALAVDALGAENVRAVMLPSRFSSDHSVDDSEKLVQNLGCASDHISIEEAFKTFENTLSGVFEGTNFGLAEENIQARARAVVLMAISNKFGYILLNTSNKSEAAVGYGTLYGDMCGGLSVLGDVYKMQVYDLARYINSDKEIIPENIINKPPSAELRPGQKDSDSLPGYEILDKVLYQYIEMRKSPQDIIKMGFDENIVKKTLKLVNTNEYKRHQAPPILRVSSKAFGMGRRMPIVAKYLST